MKFKSNFKLEREPLWHYTTEDRLRGILVDGEIKPATAHIDVGERPAVWFSHDQKWEQTANKMIADPVTGVSVPTLGIEEMAEHATPIRIQVDPTKLKLSNWIQFKYKSGISDSTAARLVDSGRAVGSKPNLWRASFEPAGEHTWIRIQAYADGAWQDYEAGGHGSNKREATTGAGTLGDSSPDQCGSETAGLRAHR